MFVVDVSLRNRLVLLGGGCAMPFLGVALVSSDQAARVVDRLDGRPNGRCRRPARECQQHTQPRPHCRDQRRADDRARARHLRRGARPEPSQLDRRRRRADGHRRLRNDVDGRLRVARPEFGGYPRRRAECRGRLERARGPGSERISAFASSTSSLTVLLTASSPPLSRSCRQL